MHCKKQQDLAEAVVQSPLESSFWGDLVMTQSPVTVAHDCLQSVISHQFFDSVKSQSLLVNFESVCPALEQVALPYQLDIK